jgi:hypothetical protein
MESPPTLKPAFASKIDIGLTPDGRNDKITFDPLATTGDYPFNNPMMAYNLTDLLLHTYIYTTSAFLMKD